VFALGLSCAVAGKSAEAEGPPIKVMPVDIGAFPQPHPFFDRPPVPVRALPQKIVEPPRDVPAHDWRSPYCIAWSDGVEFCTRDNASQAGTCKSIPNDKRSEGRVPHPVACLSADPQRLFLVCRKSLLFDPGRPIPYWGQSAFPWSSEEQANWSWNVDRAEWSLSVAQDDAGRGTPSTLPGQPSGVTLRDIRTVYCTHSYAYPIDWTEMTPGRIDTLPDQP
jgi:hypothetical protein